MFWIFAATVLVLAVTHKGFGKALLWTAAAAAAVTVLAVILVGRGA